jgi:predicted GNAT family N-acyltransferase
VYVDNKLVGFKDGEKGTTEIREQGGEAEKGVDRATTFHDGIEPYVKVGRLAVVKEMRRAKMGGLLVRTALEWLRTHPDVFGDVAGRKWNGLVCAHGQIQARPAWERMGFKVDEGMGTWMEEGIEHVGMFIRLEVVRE